MYQLKFSFPKLSVIKFFSEIIQESIFKLKLNLN